MSEDLSFQLAELDEALQHCYSGEDAVGPGGCVDCDSIIETNVYKYRDHLIRRLEKKLRESGEGSGIWKTTFKITVFSEYELGENLAASEFGDPFDLIGINYMITEGECVGDVKRMREFEVPNAILQEELAAVGNDGEFFNVVFLDSE